MNILLVGDIYSKLGRSSFERNLKKIRETEGVNFLVVNGENTSHGKGLNENHYKWYMDQGVNVVTLGNHSYSNKQIFRYIENANNLIRPINFLPTQAGKGYTIVNYNGIRICVFQVMGQVFMNNDTLSSPFLRTEELLNTVEADIYICDFHGEATSEKIAFALHFDGRINIIFGTHTHVPTADLRVLEKGTAYITDIGMTGALNGVIGTKASIIIDRFVNQGQQVFEPEDTGLSQFNAVLINFDEKNKKVISLKQINIIE